MARLVEATQAVVRLTTMVADERLLLEDLSTGAKADMVGNGVSLEEFTPEPGLLHPSSLLEKANRIPQCSQP